MSEAPRLVTIGEYHALGVITALEHRALELRFAGGLSTRQMVRELGVSRTAVRDRITNGLRKIAAFEEAKAA